VLIALLVLTGLGLGLVMPVFTLTIQNAAPMNMIGAATALSQCVRSIGATVGAAVMGAILQQRYMESMGSALVSRKVPPAVAAVLANPARMVEIKTMLAQNYGATPAGQETAGYLLEHIKTSLVFALHGIFLLGALFAFLGLATTLFLKERKLRTKSEAGKPPVASLPETG
jgi:hypothetical protein